MSSFCSGPYWDLNQTWYTDDPDFTDCFEKTVLRWIPNIYLWAILPLQLYFLFRTQKIRKRCTERLFWIKLSVLFVIIATICAELGHHGKNVHDYVHSYASIAPFQYVDIVSSSIHLLTCIIYAAYLVMDQMKGRPSSALMFFFWLIVAITDGIIFRSHIKDALATGGSTPRGTFLLVMRVLYYPAVLLQLLLSCWNAKSLEQESELKKHRLPENHVPFLSRLLFWWFNRLVYTGWKKTFQPEELWYLNPEDRAQNIARSFSRQWDRRKKDASLGWALTKAFWPELVYSALLKLVYNVMLFLVPRILSLLIGFVKNKSEELWKGYLFAVLLFVASVIQTLSIGHYFHRCNKLGIRLRTAVMGGVYRKVIQISQFVDGAAALGQPTNLISVDAQRLMDLTSYINQLWEIPLQILVAMYLLYQTLGMSAFAGLGVMVLSIPIEAGVAYWSKRQQVHQMKHKDARIKTTGEVFRAVKLLKLYAWEDHYEKQILNYRKDELRSIRIIAFLTAFSTFYSIVSPFIVALATFATYVLSDKRHVLDSSEAFVALAIFNILKNPMNMLPPTVGAVVQAIVSKRRLCDALRVPEPESYVNPDQPAKVADKSLTTAVADEAVVVTHGSFSWSKDSEPCLKKINLSIKSGKLVGIVGQAGSGKTALCRAVLGTMSYRSGSVKVRGRVAYMPQQSWLQNKTIKENIIFGRDFIRSNYQATLENCALVEDINSFVMGDETDVGDQGTNLSGGQKQRICLARTVYDYADVFIMDDPLSALDAKVSKSVFENLLGNDGVLQNKTRVIVMNGYRFLPYFDELVVMEAGQIKEIGTFPELLHRGGPFSAFLHTHLRHEIEELHLNTLDVNEATHREKDFHEICKQLPHTMKASLRVHRKSVIAIPHNKRRRSSVISHHDSLEDLSKAHLAHGHYEEHLPPKRASKNGVIDPKAKHKEAIAPNKTNWKVYGSFIMNITIKTFLVIVLTNTIATGFSVASNIWLSEWAEDNQIVLKNGTPNKAQTDYRLGIYAALGALQGVFFLISMLSLAYGLTRASKVLHNKVLYRLIRAPMYFFDTTPLGRITNRLSKDMDAVDVNVPQSLRQCLNSMFNILGTVTVLIYSYPLFAAFIVPIFIVYAVFQFFYITTSRQLKQLEAISRSPIFSHFQETLSGSRVISTFHQRDRFVEEFEYLMDCNNRIAYLSLVAQRWLSLRLEIIGNIVTFIAGLLAVYGRDHWSVHPGVVGLTITYAVQVTQVLSWFVQKASDLEMSFISVERIKEYTKCPQEADWIIKKERPPENWPSAGSLVFSHYKTKYRPDLDLALKGVSCQIQPKEKIGIVGRTGAGKSSLSLGIFRIIEATEGKILIDDVDISRIGLHDLRSRITIIPQDPFLISGSLRQNLDPSNSCSDEALWAALDAAHLKRYVESLPNGIGHLMVEGGSNFSAGQRQLVCLARAILRKSKVLVMDEATASLDAETDELIQKTIETEFADCTVLIIAHRLQSVIDCNRVMVLDAGRIQEFAEPDILLKNKESVFYSLVKDSNLLEETTEHFAAMLESSSTDISDSLSDHSEPREDTTKTCSSSSISSSR